MANDMNRTTSSKNQCTNSSDINWSIGLSRFLRPPSMLPSISPWQRGRPGESVVGQASWSRGEGGGVHPLMILFSPCSPLVLFDIIRRV